MSPKKREAYYHQQDYLVEIPTVSILRGGMCVCVRARCKERVRTDTHAHTHTHTRTHHRERERERARERETDVPRMGLLWQTLRHLEQGSRGRDREERERQGRERETERRDSTGIKVIVAGV